MYDPAALECLAAIIDEGGFERAAQRLSITQSAVSQRLRTLEAQAGAVLVVRSRPARATMAGQLLLRHAKMLRLLRADLEQELRGVMPARADGRSREHERVSLAINADSLATWVLPAFSPLIQQGLPLEIITDDQDFTLHWLREGQVLGCITGLKQPLRGCRCHLLGAMDYVLVADPIYAQRHLGTTDLSTSGSAAHRLRTQSFISYNRRDAMPTHLMAQLFGLRGVNLQQVFVPSCHAMVRAVREGWGVAVVPRQLVHHELAQGDLVNLLPRQNLALPLYWHCWNLQSAIIDSLTQALVSIAGRALAPWPGRAG